MYPFIVYGTLRHGAARARVWRGHATYERGTLAGFDLRDTGRRYPIIVPARLGTVVVDVLNPNSSESYEYLLARFDKIEEVAGGLYVRALQVATVGDTKVEGWLYQPGPRLADDIDAMPVIAGGDWFR